LSPFAAGGKGVALTAGEILLKIGGDDSRLAAVLNRASARLSAFGKGISSLGSRFSNMGKSAAIYAGALTAPLAGAVQQFASAGDALDKMSGRVGVSVESLSQLKYAAEQSGASLGDVESAVSSMSNAIGRQSARAVKAAQSIGLSLSELATLTPEAAFERVTAALASTEDQATRTAAANALLGGSGAKLAPMMNNLAGLRKEAQALGLVFTTDTAKSASLLSSAFGRVTATVKSLMYSVGGALAPTLTNIADRITSTVASVRDWIVKNQSLVVTVAKGVAAFGLLAGGLVATGTALSVVGFAVTGLAAGLSVLATVAGVVLSPVGLLVGALAGGAAAFLTMTDAGRALVDFFVGEFQSLYSVVAPVIESIVSAFRMGDLQGAAAIAFAGVKMAALSLWSFLSPYFQEGVYYLASLWDGIAFAALKAWAVIRSGLTWDFLLIGLLETGRWISNSILGIVRGVVDAFGWLVNKCIGALNSLGVISDNAAKRAKQAVSSIGEGIGAMQANNNQWYDREIRSANRAMSQTAGGRELAALEQERERKARERATALVEGRGDADRALADAQAELAALMRKQAELVAEANAPTGPKTPETTETPIARALAVTPQQATREIKADVGSTASFNARIASMMAANAATRVDEQQLEVLRQIADNTADLESGLA
jgi:hypothetical protein